MHWLNHQIRNNRSRSDHSRSQSNNTRALDPYDKLDIVNFSISENPKFEYNPERPTDPNSYVLIKLLLIGDSMIGNSLDY